MQISAERESVCVREEECVCVDVLCVREGERERVCVGVLCVREGEREGGREREREGMSHQRTREGLSKFADSPSLSVDQQV